MVGSASKSKLLYTSQWRSSVVKYLGQGQSGQAIKLFQITLYVNAFQTLNSPGSWQPVRRLEKLVLPFVFWHKSFIPDDVKLAELSNNSFERKNVTFWQSKHTLTSPTYFQGVTTPQPRLASHTSHPSFQIFVVFVDNFVIYSADRQARKTRSGGRKKINYFLLFSAFVTDSLCLGPHRAEALSDAFVWRLSDVCLSVCRVHRAYLENREA